MLSCMQYVLICSATANTLVVYRDFVEYRGSSMCRGQAFYLVHGKLLRRGKAQATRRELAAMRALCLILALGVAQNFLLVWE